MRILGESGAVFHLTGNHSWPVPKSTLSTGSSLPLLLQPIVGIFECLCIPYVLAGCLYSSIQLNDHISMVKPPARKKKTYCVPNPETQLNALLIVFSIGKPSKWINLLPYQGFGLIWICVFLMLRNHNMIAVCAERNPKSAPIIVQKGQAGRQSV